MSSTLPTIYAELEAKRALLVAMETGGPKDRALYLASEAFAGPHQEPKTLEDRVRLVALASILSRDAVRWVPTDPPRGPSETVAFAWMRFIISNDRTTLKELKRILRSNTLSKSTEEDAALRAWTVAVERLFEDSKKDSIKLFKRAIDTSCQFDLDVEDTITWTYIASFFPKTSGVLVRSR